MASGIYGRRIVDSHISDHALFAQDQYPVTGADRVLTNELESVWDKVNDAKAVLQKLEHRIETSEESKKAEDLALSLNEANYKKTPAKNSSRQLSSSLRGSSAGGQSTIPNRSVGHKVAFNEPLVSYREEFDPLHGSTPGAMSNLGSTIPDSSKSFIARDLRTNDFDLSRVTVRSKPNHVATRSARTEDTDKLPNGVSGQDGAEHSDSPLKGTVVPTRVLNNHPEEQRNDNKAIRRGRDIKAAGVATTVTHFDPDQVYKYLQMEGIRKASENASSQSVYPSGSMGTRSPLFLASPYAPHKRIEVVKQRKKMEQNSDALLRLKEKIQRQKQRSPSYDKTPSQKPSHREEDPVFTMTNNFDGDHDKPLMRKIAHGPAAPKYKGFSTAETRIRTPDGKVWKDGESNQPYIPQRTFQPEKRPKAVSSLFKRSENGRTKPPLTSGRLKSHLDTSKQNKSKNQKPMRKTGKIRQEDPVHKKSLITPSSWREGQRIAESILGPPPKKVIARDASRPDSPPTRDTDANPTTMSKKPPSRSTGTKTKQPDIGNANSLASKPTPADPLNSRNNDKALTVADADPTNNDGGLSQPKKLSSSIKASIPTDKLSVEARGVLDDLHLSSSDSESEEDENKTDVKNGQDAEKRMKRSRGRQRRPAKHALTTDPKESKKEKMQKTRHYNQGEVQEYIAKQRAERKRRQSQERKANKEAQERKQKQLDELYRKQKEAACAKKKSMELEARSRPLKQVDFAAVQAIQKMDGILDETKERDEKENESDKENLGRQPLAKFDERMSAFMDKLNHYQSTVPPSRTYIPQSKESEKRPTPSGPPPRSSDAASEFMQKLDRYLKDDTPVTAVSKYSNTSRPQTSGSTDKNEANLTVEDLSESSLRRPDTAPTYRDRYGDPAGTYSPRYRQMMSVDQPSQNEDYSKQKSKAERIAALKATAESLQERIQTNSKILSEQPIVPIQHRLEEIDAILAKSGHGQSLPIHAWSPETNKNDYRDVARWQRSSHHSGVDVPDSSHSARGGLSDLSPSQLPGVVGLRQHVDDMEKYKTETDAALKIQSNYRGHSVRQAMDDWKLPSGRSMTDVRRQAATLPSGVNSEDKIDNDDISEGPLSSRSDSLVPDTPIKLRSVEEILKEMKSREYCVADPQPLEDLTSYKWTDLADDNADSGRPEQRTDFLSDFGSRLNSGRYPDSDDIYPPPQTDIDKPPWERTGGDKYSVVNIFTNKYLKASKKKEKEKLKDERPKSVSETNLKDDKVKSSHENLLPRKSFSEHVSSSKKSPKSKSSEKYTPHFDDTVHDASDSLSSVSEDVPKSHSSISPQSSDILQLKSDVPKKSQLPPYTTPSELLVGKVSYSSDNESIDDKKFMEEQKVDQNEILSEMGSHRDESSLALEKSNEFRDAPIPTTTYMPKSRISTNTAEKKFSPAALEQKMSAELNYQEAIEESLRHLTGVERTQGVSLAQQETVSLAQLMKARQLQHEVEMERLTMKAKEEALEAEKKKTMAKIEEEDKRAEENLKMQEASRKALETQAEAARSSAQAAKQLAYALKHEPGRDRRFPDSFSTVSSDRGNRKESYSSSVSSALTRDSVSGNSSDSYDAMPPKKDAKSRSQMPKTKPLHKHSPPMSEHSTTSVHLSDNDTVSSIPEQMPSTEDEDNEYKKLDLGRKNVSDSSTITKSIEEDLSFSHKKASRVDSDRSISEDIADQSIESEVRTKGSTSKRKSTESKDHHSDSSESVHFDESLTEDERAEISRRVVVPSESHRRHQRRRGTGSLDRSDISSDDQPSSARQKTPRGGAPVKGLDDFTIGSSLSGAADSEFVHFMDQMVKQYMLEEEVRAKHQAAMLKLRERAIKEKSETELSWLEQMKKQVRNKGEDDKMPPIKKKQRAILLRLKLETDEIKKLRAVTKVASQERKLFLQQHKENAARRAKLRAAEDKLDIESELTRPRSRADEKIKEPHLTSSTPIPNANLSDLDISESNSELGISSTSSVLMKKLKKQIPGAIDQQRLTKREQRLMQRKKQAEQLIAWKKRLDQEEKKVYDIEKQALSAWEKEAGNKLDKNRQLTSGDSTDKESKEKKNLGSPKTDSSQEVSSSVKSPESDHHSSPPPPSHSESSIAEEILQINTSETNSSVSAVSPDQAEESKRSPEESSDGTNADDYSQSFESVTATQHTPRSPKSKDTETKTEKKTDNMATRKPKDKSDSNAKDVDSPSATPLLPRSKTEEPKDAGTPSKTSEKEKAKSGRRESVESWSDESFSQTQSETEQSDIECRVRALKEELKRRRMIADRLKKEQKRRHKDRLKAQEASLRSQIEAYDVFIRKTQNELTQELDHQISAASASGNNHLPVSKPQIRSPRKSDQARHNARAVRATTVAAVSPEASPRSGSHRTPAILGKPRTESESSGKSSRSLSFDDEDKIDDVTPNGSTKSFPGVVAPLPSKQDRLPLGSHDSLSSGASTPPDKRHEKPKKLDLSDAATTLSKLTKPLSPNGFTPTTSSADKNKSFIPVPSKTPPSTKSLSVKTPPSPGSQASSKLSPIQQAKKSLIPLPITTSSLDSTVALNQKLKDKVATSPPSPLASEKSIEAYSEDFDSSAASKKSRDEGSVTSEDDISEHFSSASSATATSGDKSDKSATMLDLASLDKQKDSFTVNKDDTLHGVEDLADAGDKVGDADEDDEKTPVVSPAQTPIPSSPRTPTPDLRESSVPPFNNGDRVLLAGRETGIVRFVGETSFAPGVWVGAELQNPNGKNDGSVNGVRYFMCASKHGIFAPLARVSLLSPKSQSTASAKSGSLHFEYEEDAPKSHVSDEEKTTSQSDLSKAISDAAKNFEAFAKDVDKGLVSPEAEVSPKPTRTGLDRNRLADELSDKLLNSLLEDSVTSILDSHADKRLRQNQNQEERADTKRRKKDDADDTASSDEDVLLSASTKQLLEMLASSPDQAEAAVADDEPDEGLKTKDHESLADTFTGDLLKDTLNKVLEIKRQRAKKWREMGVGEDEFRRREDYKLDDGQEVEDILDAKRKLGTDEDSLDDKESTTPVRPVSPIFGAGQDDEWMFDEDIGLSSFHEKKPVINKEDNEGAFDVDDEWKEGRLVESLSGRLEPLPPPPKFVVPHKPQHILRLVEDATDYYYSKYLRGELISDVRIPDFLYNDKEDELSEKEDNNNSDESDQEKKEADLNANHIFKTSLFDMVRELITEIYSSKTTSDELSKRPLWLKKKTVRRPPYCRRIPKNGEELLAVVSQQVNKLLNLDGDSNKIDPKITMKWGSRKKKDKVDLILIQELREEEPEWTNYDEDETTVKMQLTDTVLDMLLSDTVRCLDGIEKKRGPVESVAIPTGQDSADAEERSQ